MVEGGISFLYRFPSRPRYPWWLPGCPNTADSWTQPGEMGNIHNTCDERYDEVYHDERKDILVRIVEKAKRKSSSTSSKKNPCNTGHYYTRLQIHKDKVFFQEVLKAQI